jgi:hypothetical protein
VQTVVDTAELPSANPAEVDEAVRSLASDRPAEPPHPDAFRYEITRLDDPGQPPAIVHEHEVPHALSDLVRAVNEGGKPEGGGGAASAPRGGT